MRIALTQSNLDQADDFLLDVSHPESPNFGKHWTHEEIANKFAPSPETFDTVKSWLVSSGIAPERISKSQSLGWLKFHATVAEAESLLKTEYHLYKHEIGKPHVACSDYHLPEHVAPHVDFITPGVNFDTKVPHGVVKPMEKRAPSTTAAAGPPVKTHAALGLGAPSSGSLPKKGANIDIKSIFDELKNCNKVRSLSKAYESSWRQLTERSRPLHPTACGLSTCFHRALPPTQRTATVLSNTRPRPICRVISISSSPISPRIKSNGPRLSIPSMAVFLKPPTKVSHSTVNRIWTWNMP